MNDPLLFHGYFLLSANSYRVAAAVYCAVIEALKYFAWGTIAEKSFFLLIDPALSLQMHCFYIVETNMGGEVVSVLHLTERLSARLDGDK